jgi:hypothetical protein
LRESVQSKCAWRCHKSQFLYENLQGKGHAPRPGKPFSRACTVEMHMDMSEFYARILR